MSKTVGLVIGVLAIVAGVLGIYYTFFQPATPPPSDQIMVPPSKPTITNSTPTPVPYTLTSAIWMTTTIVTEPVLEAAVPFIRFNSDGTVTGSDGCNNFSTRYTTDQNQLTIKPEMAMTRKACPRNIELQANEFVQNLTAVTAYEIQGEVLQLLNKDAAVLEFQAQSQSVVGNWEVISYNNGSEAVVSVLQGTTITANFSAENTLSGTAGCNNYSSHYTTQDTAISITAPSTTEMYCDQPVGVSEQEKAYLQALPTTATYQIVGDTLELRTTTGALVATMSKLHSISTP